jgi:hypothetical protein
MLGTLEPASTRFYSVVLSRLFGKCKWPARIDDVVPDEVQDFALNPSKASHAAHSWLEHLNATVRARYFWNGTSLWFHSRKEMGGAHGGGTGFASRIRPMRIDSRN